jgi:Carboxypeptidase regulatory-like domain/TonB dependent receptor
MKKLQLCLLSFSLLALSLTAFAQIQNGQFTGVVTDPSGASVANAQVTVINVATNLSVKTTTNQEGTYVAKELPVGTYRITAEAQGFKTTTNANLELNAGTIQRVDFKMQLGQTREVIEVTGEARAVNTEDSKLASTVNSDQVANLPLNGRNIYDLMQMAPGAVNVRGVLTENGANTVVNGLREDFNGFLINGSSNKGLSGGAVNQPIEDTVQEFQQLTLNMSAQYGNSAGSVTNLVTKAGTNSFHGSGWEFNRNDAYDANSFFLNKEGVDRQATRFNQFGGTFGGPIIKDKLFFFLSYQGDHFRESAPPSTLTVESPQFEQAVITALPNSAAALLYSNFKPTHTGAPVSDLTGYLPNEPDGFNSFTNYLCATQTTPLIASRIAAVIGVTAQDNVNLAAAGCPVLPLQAGTFPRTGVPFELNAIAFNGSQNQNNVSEGNLFNGWEGSARLDYNFSSKDRLFTQLNWNRLTDSFGFPNTVSQSNGRGSAFLNPVLQKYPNGQISYIHTFSPAVLNEFRAGYTLNVTGDVTTATPGVPDLRFDDSSMGFGSYAGYPQTFHENVYTYSDMVSISHGKHSMKVGVDFRRNIENSEFNVARPSYYFFDPLFFAADSPYSQSAGVDPGILSGHPAQLASNVRHWRNLEMGAYFQDDWKVTRNLTLNLGMRYDLYTRHTEENNQVTTFIRGPGSGIIDNISTGAGQIQSASIPAGLPGCDTPTEMAQAQLAGVCGPGGFTKASSLGKGDHNNLGPRVGFAWDMFGDGKSSLRGGFGVSYEGTLYNPLSNSRWNLPYYSFNSATSSINGGTDTVIYGPYSCNPTCAPNTTAVPTFTGPATNPNQGVGAQAVGNLTGWDPSNPNTAILTGIVYPEGIRDPYVYNYFMGFQREIMPRLVVEANYAGTTGHKLFRAENVNRIPGGRLPAGSCVTDNFGRQLCGQVDATNPLGRLNPNFGTLRVWENVSNSNYNSLQLSVKKQASHGMTFNLNYTYSHAIDEGSTWHSGATSSNGPAAGEGYTTDVTQPALDRGNSIFDVRQRLVGNYVLELPWYRSQQGFLGHILGGWSNVGVVSWQTGAHWEPFRASSRKLVDAAGNTCTAADVNSGNCTNVGGDYNLDGVANDRPNALADHVNTTNSMWANGWGPLYEPGGGFFTSPCLGCTGNLGRNTFVGPSFVGWDTSVHKKIKVTERVNMEFRAEAFNTLNHTNFQLPGAHNATNNRITASTFGQAGSTFNPRQMQLGLKISF